MSFETFEKAYNKQREILLHRLASLRNCDTIAEITTEFEKSLQREKLQYIKISKTLDPDVCKYFIEICNQIQGLPTFKETVFELLEKHQFENCQSFLQLLKKWNAAGDAASKLKSIPTLEAFCKNTEPHRNKLPFYKAAFEYLTRYNLAEFLATAIVNSELSDTFITDLKNARVF